MQLDLQVVSCKKLGKIFIPNKKTYTFLSGFAFKKDWWK